MHITYPPKGCVLGTCASRLVSQEALHILTSGFVLQAWMACRAGVRTWLRGSAERLAGERSATPSPPPEREHEREARPPPPPGEPAPLWRSVQDRPRVVTSLALAPRFDDARAQIPCFPRASLALLLGQCWRAGAPTPQPDLRYPAILHPTLASPPHWRWRPGAPALPAGSQSPFFINPYARVVTSLALAPRCADATSRVSDTLLSCHTRITACLALAPSARVITKA